MRNKMRNKKARKLLAICIAAAMTAGLTACGGGGEQAESQEPDSSADSAVQTTETTETTGAAQTTQESQENAEAAGSKQEPGEVVTISLYPADANISSGVISGYKGDYFAQNGIELEVWAYSDERTNAMLASGDLSDVLYVSKDNLDTMIEAGMLLNLEDYLDQMPHVLAYEPMEQALNYMRAYWSAGTGELYALPLSVGDTSTKAAILDSTERNALKIRWDVYEEIGAPKINNLDDLLDVMEAMMEAHPTDEDGTKCYGTVLNQGSDTTYWMCIEIFYRWFGYDDKELPYLLEADMVNGTYSPILTRESKYYEGLKWYNKAFRRDLIDPDSFLQDRATQKPKVDSGLAMVPSGYLPGWADKYEPYLLPGTSVYYNYKSAYGDPNKVIAINANTEHLDACLKLLDMWCDPVAYLNIISGPEGEFWYLDGDDAYLTDSNLEYLREYGNGGPGQTFSSGEEGSLWNTAFCLNTGAALPYSDGEGGERVLRLNEWKESQEILTESPILEQWRATTGYNSWSEWLEAEDALCTESSLDNIETFVSLPDDSMQFTVDSIKNTIVNSSWRMVQAESDEEFEQIWDQMVADCEGLGAQDVIDWRLADIENAKSLRDSLK